MVIFDADNTQAVSGVSPQTCFIELKIRSGVPLRSTVPALVEDSMPEQLIEVHSGSDSEVVAKLRDRIWYRRPMIALDDVRTEYKSHEILEQGKTQDKVIETAQMQIAGDVTARDSGWNRAEMVLEMQGISNPSKSLDERLDENKEKPTSLKEIFPSVEKLSEDSILFGGRYAPVQIETLHRATDAANGTLKPTDMVLACRKD